MNELNYASFEASKRLVDAGVVLETDAIWSLFYNGWRLVLRTELHPLVEDYPAPSMAEVWRELQKNVIFYGANLYFSFQLLDQGFYSNQAKFADDLGRIESPTFISDNPADALAELLIWVRREK